MRHLSMSMFAAVMGIVTLVACASEDTAVGEFKSALEHGDRLSAEIVAKDVAVTNDVLTEVLWPLMEATQPMLDLLDTMRDPGADLAALQAELAPLASAEADFRAITERLGFSGTDLDAHQSSTGMAVDGYARRIACRVAVVAAGTGCVALCGASGPAAPECIAACSLTAASGLMECNRIRRW